MSNVELSDIYPVAFLCCVGINYEIKTELNSNGKRRLIFVFSKNIDRVKALIRNYYGGQEDLVSANKYARILKELKSLVHNY